MATLTPIRTAVEISTLATARNLCGSSSPGMTERTMARVVLRSSMTASAVATGRPLRTGLGEMVGQKRKGVERLREAEGKKQVLRLRLSRRARQTSLRMTSLYFSYLRKDGRGVPGRAVNYPLKPTEGLSRAPSAHLPTSQNRDVGQAPSHFRDHS